MIPAEPAGGARVYLCAFGEGESRSWLALGGDGGPLRERRLLRDAVSIAAMCELAEETAGGGDLRELRAQLATLKATENPEGIDEAEDAAAALEATFGDGLRVASPAYLDEIGGATRRLEQALGEVGSIPVRRGHEAGIGLGRRSHGGRRGGLQARAHLTGSRYALGDE